MSTPLAPSSLPMVIVGGPVRAGRPLGLERCDSRLKARGVFSPVCLSAWQFARMAGMWMVPRNYHSAGRSVVCRHRLGAGNDCAEARE
jgi:hypothetical protein